MTATDSTPSTDSTRPLSSTERSTLRRNATRAATDRRELYRILDAGLFCHLAVIVDGEVRVLPTGYGRDGDLLFLHGSTGARSLRVAAAGTAVSVAVTLLDGVVYGRSVFHHSMNYRSAVIYAAARSVTDDGGKLHGLRTITNHLAPGSWEHARTPSSKELAATSVLAMGLDEASVKIRTGPPADETDDVTAGGRWAGVLPLRQSWGPAEPCPLLEPGFDLPTHITGRTQPPLAGERIREPSAPPRHD